MRPHMPESIELCTLVIEINAQEGFGLVVSVLYRGEGPNPEL